MSYEEIFRLIAAALDGFWGLVWLTFYSRQFVDRVKPSRWGLFLGVFGVLACASASFNLFGESFWAAAFRLLTALTYSFASGYTLFVKNANRKDRRG